MRRGKGGDILAVLQTETSCSLALSLINPITISLLPCNMFKDGLDAHVLEASAIALELPDALARFDCISGDLLRLYAWLAKSQQAFRTTKGGRDRELHSYGRGKHKT